MLDCMDAEGAYYIGQKLQAKHSFPCDRTEYCVTFLEKVV